jgi:hypothetical protein
MWPRQAQQLKGQKSWNFGFIGAIFRGSTGVNPTTFELSLQRQRCSRLHRAIFIVEENICVLKTR